MTLPNKTTITILKTLAGTLAVTLLAVFAIWFMAGGVLFMPPFAVIPVYGILFILSVLVALVTQKPIVILSVVGGFVLGMFGFNALYNHTCGPNSSDVKVMNPMAEKISNYIIKNGIPKSLKDIPDLPYGLVGCERSVEYSKFNNDTLMAEILNSKDKADFYQINEKCNFLDNNRVYYTELSEGMSIPVKEGNRGSIDIGNEESSTWASLGFSINNVGKITIGYDFTFGSSKNTGICKPWKQ